MSCQRKSVMQEKPRKKRKRRMVASLGRGISSCERKKQSRSRCGRDSPAPTTLNASVSLSLSTRTHNRYQWHDVCDPHYSRHRNGHWLHEVLFSNSWDGTTKHGEGSRIKNVKTMVKYKVTIK